MRNGEPDLRGAPQVLEFQIEGGVLDVRELPGVRVPRVDPSRPVIISGRGPHWLYAYIVHEIHFARVLGTFEPRLGKGIVVSAPSRDLLGKGMDLETGEAAPVSLGAKGKLRMRILSSQEFDIVEVQIVGDRFVEPSVLQSIDIRGILERLDPQKGIIISGLMPIWLGAFFHAELANYGQWYGVYDPRLGGAVVVARHHPDAPEVGTVVPVRASSKPKIIAVVGDPNSGKSVFLNLLNDALRKRGLITLTQEGDIFAPTQNWSLYAPELRKRLKKNMEPGERLRWVLRSLEGVRASTLDVVLVDVGGGRPDLGVRVTKENEEILKRVDAVIIVSRNDQGQIEAWKWELAEKLPGLRVVAALESIYDPSGNYDFSKENAVWHLDRTAYANREIPEETLRVVDAVAEEVVRLD